MNPIILVAALIAQDSGGRAVPPAKVRAEIASHLEKADAEYTEQRKKADAGDHTGAASHARQRVQFTGEALRLMRAYLLQTAQVTVGAADVFADSIDRQEKVVARNRFPRSPEEVKESIRELAAEAKATPSPMAKLRLLNDIRELHYQLKYLKSSAQNGGTFVGLDGAAYEMLVAYSGLLIDLKWGHTMARADYDQAVMSVQYHEMKAQNIEDAFASKPADRDPLADGFSNPDKIVDRILKEIDEVEVDDEQP